MIDYRQEADDIYCSVAEGDIAVRGIESRLRSLVERAVAEDRELIASEFEAEAGMLHEQVKLLTNRHAQSHLQQLAGSKSRIAHIIRITKAPQPNQTEEVKNG